MRRFLSWCVLAAVPLGAALAADQKRPARDDELAAWVDQRVNLATSLGSVPASWFNSADSFASIIVVPPLLALWSMQARRGSDDGDTTC